MKGHTNGTKRLLHLWKNRGRRSPSEREHYFEGNEFGFPRIEAYEGAVRCAFMLGKFDEAFYWAENTRGRIFSELLSKRHSGKGDTRFHLSLPKRKKT